MSQRRSTQRKSGERRRAQEHDDNDVDMSSADDHIVGRVLRYLLAANRKKTAIRASQIKKMALSNNAKDFRAVMPRVKASLENLFGYQLIDLKPQKYFLVNKFQNDGIQLHSSEERAEQVVLFLTLAYIFMSTDNEGVSKVAEDELWSFFNNLEIIRETNEYADHPIFGSVKELISSKFVDQLYLERTKTGEGDQFAYQWGPRANLEMDRRSVLEFVSKVHNNRPIETWVPQYTAMRNIEQPPVQREC